MEQETESSLVFTDQLDVKDLVVSPNKMRSLLRQSVFGSVFIIYIHALTGCSHNIMITALSMHIPDVQSGQTSLCFWLTLDILNAKTSVEI